MVHCPSCGAGLRFDIETQAAVCDHCRSSFDPSKLPDDVYDDAVTDSYYQSCVYVCPDCGAQLTTTDKNDAIAFCPYCGGASMIFDKIRKEWKPAKLIPFSVTKEQCKELYCKEVKKHKFVSKKYRDPNLIESFRGIYMPYWSYQALMKGEFKLKADAPERAEPDYYYVTDHYDVKGKTDFTLSGYTHDASAAFDDHLSERLAPYDPEKEVDFNPAFMGGFYAETGDTPPDEYSRYAEEKMTAKGIEALESDETIKNELKKQGLNINRSETSVPVKLSKAQKMLYPVWFMSYRNGDKITYATVNGQTGKVAADLPLSPVKIIVAALVLAGVFFGALAAFMNFLPTIKAAATLELSVLLLCTGIFALQHCFLRVIENTLETGSYTIKKPGSGKPGNTRFKITYSPGTYGLASVVAFFSIILSTSDGSADRLLGSVGTIALIATGAYMLLRHFTQIKLTVRAANLQYSSESMLNNGIISESKKFLKTNTVLLMVLYATAILGGFLVYKEIPSKTLLYACCFVSAAELMGLCLLHIRFQANLAKRRLPQFDKKGAVYDEN